MRPLGIYLIGISMYILNMIHFLMILADFGVFSLMVTDGRTYGRTYDGRTNPLIEMRGRIYKRIYDRCNIIIGLPIKEFYKIFKTNRLQHKIWTLSKSFRVSVPMVEGVESLSDSFGVAIVK